MIHLSDEVAQHLARALTDGHPVVASSVDAEGQPHLSYFGTTQVFSPDQLAIWVRDSASGFLQRIAVNPKVAFLYRNPHERVMYQFHGHAHPTADEDTRTTIYENSPEIEQSMDPERLGTAVVIDLDRVKGRAQGKPFEQTPEP
jgi:predicted pyridoxine 5'-phosphate oxidase superfamily flavin-nucleotide-binding protein